MSYKIAGTTFPTKGCITEHCRGILYRTRDGVLVAQENLPFLFELFQHHDEWQQKSGDGVSAITTQTGAHGTRGFVLIRKDDRPVNISFPHSIKLILSSAMSGESSRPNLALRKLAKRLTAKAGTSTRPLRPGRAV